MFFDVYYHSCILSRTFDSLCNSMQTFQVRNNTKKKHYFYFATTSQKLCVTVGIVIFIRRWGLERSITFHSLTYTPEPLQFVDKIVNVYVFLLVCLIKKRVIDIRSHTFISNLNKSLLNVLIFDLTSLNTLLWTSSNNFTYFWDINLAL